MSRGLDAHEGTLVEETVILFELFRPSIILIHNDSATADLKFKLHQVEENYATLKAGETVSLDLVEKVPKIYLTCTEAVAYRVWAFA